ncbi:hypothetical protein INR49_006310 [Caranx melampygus]|nr:hypothetical protein INR49_006310 [Caranx melampygus]
MLSVAVLLLWEELVCDAATMNSVLVPKMSGEGGGGGGVVVPRQRRRRRKRSWVWNQFFILEEFTGDEPLYVGKTSCADSPGPALGPGFSLVHQLVSSGGLTSPWFLQLHSDLDKGDGQVRYVLNGEGASSVFTIDENTGDIHANKRLDREQQAYYTLRAQARDRTLTSNLNLTHSSSSKSKTSMTMSPSSWMARTAPEWLRGPLYLLLLFLCSGESCFVSTGTSVVTVVATDADDPTYGNSARLVYSILQGQPYFSVEPKTGVVRTAQLGLDREVQDQYVVVVQAKDMIGQIGGLSGTTSVTVTLTDVNDNPPRFYRKSYQISVPESVPVSSVVAKIKALDLDVGPNAEMDYRFLDVRTTVFKPVSFSSIQALDFETKSSFTLRVEASNRYIDTRFLSVGPFIDVATVLLLVEDVNEAPVFSSVISHMEISEAAAVGTDVGSVSAYDPDKTRSPVRFSIDLRSDKQRFFTIDSSSGLIRTNQPLDREISALHNITVLATKSLDPSQVGKAVVLVSVMDVNDNAPTFAMEYQLLVCENSKPGQVDVSIIETLSAVDRDEPDNGHHFLFSLATEAAGNLNFTIIDNKDNTVSVLNRRGGFLQQDQWLYFLTVVITDNGSPSLSSTNTLSITVCDCDLHGRRRSCGQQTSPLLVVSLNPVAATILTCILTLLGVVIVTMAIGHRRRKSLMIHDEQEIRENIVHYDDEGGGEEDTEAFDMFALRHLTPKDPEFYRSRLPPTPESNMGRNQLFQEFIRDRLAEADLDLTAPSYDSLQTYAFEGSRSTAVSLCSLTSLESEQNYDFLREWGPKFRKLADLYGSHEGGGASS